MTLMWSYFSSLNFRIIIFKEISNNWLMFYILCSILSDLYKSISTTTCLLVLSFWLTQVM